MNKSDIGKALQDAYIEGYRDCIGSVEVIEPNITQEMGEIYDLSDTRTLVNEIWDGDLTL